MRNFDGGGVRLQKKEEFPDFCDEMFFLFRAGLIGKEMFEVIFPDVPHLAADGVQRVAEGSCVEFLRIPFRGKGFGIKFGDGGMDGFCAWLSLFFFDFGENLADAVDFFVIDFFFPDQGSEGFALGFGAGYGDGVIAEVFKATDQLRCVHQIIAVAEIVVEFAFDISGEGSVSFRLIESGLFDFRQGAADFEKLSEPRSDYRFQFMQFFQLPCLIQNLVHSDLLFFLQHKPSESAVQAGNIAVFSENAVQNWIFFEKCVF